jgi:hypothetical protein
VLEQHTDGGKADTTMSGKLRKDAIGRGETVRSLERFGTRILGIGIIIMMISVPVLLAALLLYLAFD